MVCMFYQPVAVLCLPACFHLPITIPHDFSRWCGVAFQRVSSIFFWYNARSCAFLEAKRHEITTSISKVFPYLLGELSEIWVRGCTCGMTGTWTIYYLNCLSTCFRMNTANPIPALDIQPLLWRKIHQSWGSRIFEKREMTDATTAYLLVSVHNVLQPCNVQRDGREALGWQSDLRTLVKLRYRNMSAAPAGTIIGMSAEL